MRVERHEEGKEGEQDEEQENNRQDLYCRKKDGDVLCGLEDLETGCHEGCDLFEGGVDLFGVREAHGDRQKAVVPERGWCERAAAARQGTSDAEATGAVDLAISSSFSRGRVMLFHGSTGMGHGLLLGVGLDGRWIFRVSGHRQCGWWA